MDIKISNVDADILRTALEQARQGRLYILGKMAEAISQPSEELSEFAPRILSFTVDPDKIGLLIGPGGKTIKSIQERHGVETNINDDGTVTIFTKDAEKGQNAKQDFMKLLEEPEVGKVYDGVVRRIVDFGAFIEFLPGKEGLCHISKMSEERIGQVSDVLQLNQVVPVKIIEIDKMGRVNLSLLVNKSTEEQTRSRGGSREGGGRDRGHGDRGHGSRGGHGGGHSRRPESREHRDR
jgi:polyribonucleotide nucleotidyltransferase